VAINRHEFHPQSNVASATLSRGTALYAPVLTSPSSLAPVRGTAACSAVRHAQRSSHVAPHRAATSSHDGVFASPVAATTPVRCSWSTPVTAVTTGTPDYVRFFEAT